MLRRLSQLEVSSDFILGILPCAVVLMDVMNGISASQPTEDRYGDQEAFNISSELPEVECPTHTGIHLTAPWSKFPHHLCYRLGRGPHIMASVSLSCRQ